jgi:hypothetical protein
MRLPDKYGIRLQTKNFRKVASHAVLSMDYNQSISIIELEFVNNEVYHYLHAGNKEWNKLIEFSNKGEGLGTYINQEFKKKFDYYKLIVISDR